VFGLLASLLAVAEEPAAVPASYTAGKWLACADYSQGKVFLVGPDGTVRFEAPAPSCDDIWALENGNLLFNTGHGVREVTRAGATVFEYKSASEVFACQRLANGDTFVGECSTGRLLDVAPDGTTIAKEVRLLPEGKDGGHAFMRNARRLLGGHTLVALTGAQIVREVDAEGKTVWEVPAPSGPHSVARLPNGNTLIATGDLAKDPRLFEVDPAGKVVWEVSNRDLPGAPLRFLTGFHRLPNGNTLISNWLGHGELGKAPHLLEITPEKKVVWTYENHKDFRTIASVVVLDAEGKAPGTAIVH
jgi:outer membrane protein assembly factor BamB